VRDLGSLGGTFVNGELFDKRPEGMGRDEALKRRFKERNLKDGAELRLCKHGAAVFRVSVRVPTLCADCGVWIPDDLKAGCEQSSGVYRCEGCKARAAADQAPRVSRACPRCGRDVAGEADAARPGEFLCAACRDNPAEFVRDMPAAVQGYTILRELGRGGMGSVWLARHNDSGRQVALKLMLPRVAADERAVQRFLGEMAHTRMLNHPNVVRATDGGYSRGAFFIVLEYCDGGSVADMMKQRGGTLPLDEAVEITLQTLEGLRYAHNVFGPGKGLVHRDLKPANLFLSGGGSGRVARVGDYGLAKAFDDAGLSGNTRTGEVGGTACFMPRQQVIDFKYAGPEVDVWAAAASLYHVLTGSFPRDFPQDRDPWLVVLETDPVPIRRRRQSVPAKLADLIDRALKDDPELHFKTAAEFRDALEEAV
jgi:serine/threonine-protein kinase